MAKNCKARKNDSGKPKIALFPPKALWGISEAMTFGGSKYESYNYKNGKGLDWDRPFSAGLRHLTQFWDGEDIDKESKLNHLYHAGACIAMLIDLYESKMGKDTRFAKQKRVKKRRIPKT